MIKLLIANRGEIAIRIARTAADMNIKTVAIFSCDDATNLHVKRADESYALPGIGARAYLDMEAVIAAAKSTGADAIHPGYGFLSENAAFAQRVEDAGLIFVGPTPQAMSLLGDKIAAKQRAEELGVPTIPGTSENTSRAQAETFFSSLPVGASMVIKAVAGGGGRGMRVVNQLDDVADAWQRCRSEAEAAFGVADVYVERFLPAVRHIEVQILGDGQGACINFAERECTLQRRHQKLIEIAPSPSLTDIQRKALVDYAEKIANSVGYRSLGTFEFLFATDSEKDNLFFIEANPRIQVEHTVTEEIFDTDLVRCQLAIANGKALADLSLPAMPKGYAIQSRINMERMDGNANASPTSGTISIYEPPTGASVRVDGFAYSGYQTSASFDGLLAKIIVSTDVDEFSTAVAKAARALSETRIVGLETNLTWLRALLSHVDVINNNVSTGFIEANAEALYQSAQLFVDEELNTNNPQQAHLAVSIPEGLNAVVAPMQSTVVSFSVQIGDEVAIGQELAILEAMKMEHVVVATTAGKVVDIMASVGETLMESQAFIVVDPSDVEQSVNGELNDIDLDRIRDDLREVEERRAFGLDENRPEAVAKRHAKGKQTARENLAQMCDPDSFIEYGEFAIAAQRQRRSLEDLIKNTSGDGILTGLGSINGDLFDETLSRCAFALGDYMVLAGTQGQRHHRKLDRLFHTAEDWNIPVVIFGEGGGGRPGDTERITHAGISNGTFTSFANLSGKVPLVGVVSGRCFAGNAAFLGCCDVIIGDESANIGMAGPAMIEGGGLGVYPPQAIGPIDEQCKNGVIDIRVKDEKEACEVVKKYLSYFQGAIKDWQAPDQRNLRHVIPENRLRVYEIRDVIDNLADIDSVLEIRKEFGVGVVTAFIRIEGKPFGVIANNPKHLGGAIDADAADKLARFIQLCDGFDIPLLSLCDCPGFMVGPEAEKTALVRHVSRVYVTARSITVPMFGVVLRKCYGLGAMAMLGGGTLDNFFTVSWPTGEFGPMGLEGAVRLGFRKELDAIDDPEVQKALFDKLLNEMYEQGKAMAVASSLEVDAVIDPIDTRKTILAGLRSAQLRPPLSGRKRPCIDSW
ncbi:acetyl-CoA carboxylase family protein [Aurantivibrio plasticivorans]